MQNYAEYSCGASDGHAVGMLYGSVKHNKCLAFVANIQFVVWLDGNVHKATAS